jgi:hypothetical protein
MRPDLRDRLERVLQDLPQWEEPDHRRSLLRGILSYRPVWDLLDLKGSAAAAANALIDPEAMSALVAGLRAAQPRGHAELEFLATQLSGGATRPRGQWKGAPYPGLVYFDRQHAPIYFGPEGVLRELIQTLGREQGQRFTVVLGASGSGKSSLVHAGLWARLAAGEVAEMAGSEQWLIGAMTPTDAEEPMGSLRASALKAAQEHEGFRNRCDWKKELGRLKGEGIAALAEGLLRDAPAEARWLVILDQMEELFAGEVKQAGAEFLDRLIEATQGPSRVRVVATLRADFYHHCLEYPPLARLMARAGGAFPVGPADRRSLEEMVSGPLNGVELNSESRNQARALPWLMDPELPAAIAADAEQRPGGLALMAFALRELYDACQSTRRMDMASYRSVESGELGGAITRKAEATIALLGKGGEKALERVFARLVRVDGDDAAVRRRERCSIWEGDSEALEVIQRFQEARLLVADRGAGGDPTIEVAHEALLREWPRLAQ